MATASSLKDPGGGICPWLATKKNQLKKGPKRIKQHKGLVLHSELQSKMPFTLKSLLMDFLSRISDLSDLVLTFEESSLTCSRGVCPVLSISTLEKKPLILKEHSLLLPLCPFVCSAVSPSPVQGVSELPRGRALQKGVAFLCPQSRAQHAPARAARVGISSYLRQAFKTHQPFKGHPSCCQLPSSRIPE